MKDTPKIDSLNYQSKFFIITGLLSAVGYSTQVLLSGWLSLPFAILEIAFMALVLTFFVRIFTRRGYTFRLHFFRFFLLLSSLTGALSLFMWIGASFFNTFPGALSKVTLTNGEKTIIYYQMSHIATKRYYDEIKKSLKDYSKDSYYIYLEGVLPGTNENQKRLEQALGIKISSGTYADIARVMRMESQDERLIEGIDSKFLIHADLGVDAIVSYLSTGSIRQTEPIDITKEFETLSATSQNSWALSYIFRSILNASIRYSLASDGMFDTLGPETMQALLDKRNQKVVDTYFERNTTNSVFLYGALHFDGIYALLKSKDPRWSIQKYEPLYPYVD